MRPREVGSKNCDEFALRAFVLVTFSRITPKGNMLTLTILKAWLLSVMLTMEPNTAWKSTYETTAEAIAVEAIAHPLFPGEDGRRTASIFASLGFFESHFKPNAEGDCDKTNDQGMCVVGSRPHSFCAFQVNETNFAFLGVTRTQILEDINICTQAAGKMIRQSFRVCSGRPIEDRLNQYATGGGRCIPSVPKGRHRIVKAQWIFGRFALAKGTAQNDITSPFLTAASQ